MALNDTLNNLLLAADLDETSARIYVELRKKPASSIWELVQRTGFSKSSVYRAFETLARLKMASRSEDGIKTLSPKHLIAKLLKSGRKSEKIAKQLKKVAPFLRVPIESVEEFEPLYDAEQIRDAYISMSQLEYGVNLDFGDFENFITTIGDIALANRFRLNRAKHAGHHAICTTYGPNTAYFSTKEAAAQFKNKIDFLNSDFKNKFIIFSDTNDCVLFCDVNDREFPTGTFVKSRLIADVQRMNFANFSQRIGNC